MATTYAEAGSDVLALAAKLIEANHRHLLDAKVSITYLMASAGAGEAPLKHGGYPAAALVRRTSLKDRVAGLTDAVIYIDAAGWANWTDRRRAAVLDHELHHLEVKRDRDGRVEKDDAGRPKLTLRKHDIQIGGFAEIIERHGEHSVEAEQVHAASQYTQGMFPGWG